MEPNATRWARFGPAQPRWFIHVPKGGVCLSAFILVRNRRREVLLGRPAPHPAWPDRGALPLWRVNELVRSGEWVLPASHLKVGEHPDAAAVRIARDWAGVRHPRPLFLGIDSSRRRTATRRGGRTQYHWDIGFLYEVRASALRNAGPWWSETRFVSRATWERMTIGRGHRDLLAEWTERAPEEG